MTRRKLYSGAACLVFAVLIFVARWSKQPAVSTSTVGQSQVKAAVSEEFTTYTNEYITLQIPKRFIAKNPVIGSGKPLYLQQLLTVPLQNGGILSDQLALVIGEAPVGGIGEVSDVHLRARSAEYTLLQSALPNIVSYESTHESSYEIAYFAKSGSKYVSIVLTTSAANTGQAKEQANIIMRSLQWLQ